MQWRGPEHDCDQNMIKHKDILNRSGLGFENPAGEISELSRITYKETLGKIPIQVEKQAF